MRSTTHRALAVAVGLLGGLAAAGPAAAITVSDGHYDIEAEVTCSNDPQERSIEFHLHDEDGVYAPHVVDFGDTFSVSVVGDATDEALIGASSGDARVIEQDDDYRLGFNIEYVDCGENEPEVTIKRRSGTQLTAPPVGAAYLRGDEPHTTIDTREPGLGDPDWNFGYQGLGHLDYRWVFTAGVSTVSSIQLEATASGFPTAFQTVAFDVS